MTFWWAEGRFPPEMGFDTMNCIYNLISAKLAYIYETVPNINTKNFKKSFSQTNMALKNRFYPLYWYDPYRKFARIQGCAYGTLRPSNFLLMTLHEDS